MSSTRLRGAQHRSHRAASPRSFRRSPSLMMLLNGLILLRLIMSGPNCADHHLMTSHRDKPALTHELQKGAPSHLTNAKLRDPFLLLITILLTFLSTLQDLGLAMSEKATDDGINTTPRNRRQRSATVVPGNGGLPSNPPTANSIVPAFFQIGTPNYTPDRDEGGLGASDANSRSAPASSANAGHPAASELQRGGARLRSRDAEPRSVRVGMISAHA